MSNLHKYFLLIYLIMETIDYIISEFCLKSKTLINLYILIISLYNILYILIKEKYKDKLINIYKNINSHSNNIDMNNSNSDNEDNYKDFIEKVDLIKKSHSVQSNKEEEQEKENDEESKEESDNSENEQIFIKNKKKTKKIIDPEQQMENLDDLFRKKIMGNLSSEKEKIIIYKDDLQRISKNFENKVIENSLRGFSVEKQLFLIDLSKLIENIKIFDMENHVCEVLYKMYNKWYIINKKDNKLLPDDSKFLQKCLKIFTKNDKFRKKINNIQFRCLKKNYIQYKTSQYIELIIVTKFIDKNKNKKIENKDKKIEKNIK
jgi:hypothetical protein